MEQLLRQVESEVFHNGNYSNPQYRTFWTRLVNMQLAPYLSLTDPADKAAARERILYSLNHKRQQYVLAGNGDGTAFVDALMTQVNWWLNEINARPRASPNIADIYLESLYQNIQRACQTNNATQPKQWEQTWRTGIRPMCHTFFVRSTAHDAKNAFNAMLHIYRTLGNMQYTYLAPYLNFYNVLQTEIKKWLHSVMMLDHGMTAEAANGVIMRAIRTVESEDKRAFSPAGGSAANGHMPHSRPRAASPSPDPTRRLKPRYFSTGGEALARLKNWGFRRAPAGPSVEVLALRNDLAGFMRS
jgi:hypothetical protein